MDKITLKFNEIEIHPAGNDYVKLTVPKHRLPFFPAYFIIPDDVAPHFLITAIRIGRDSQLISPGAIPAELFEESAPEIRLILDQISDPERDELRVSATNISDQKRLFTMQVMGYVGSPGYASPPVHILGYGFTSVPGNGAANILVQPQRSFIPQSLFLPRATRDNFRIESVKSSMMKTDTPLHDPNAQSRDRFIELSRQPSIEVRPFITISVTNTSPAQKSFSAAIMGSLG